MDFSTTRWLPTATPGVLQATLHPPSGPACTALMKLEPGTRTEPHAHPTQSEEIFVLDGCFEDDHGTYQPGDYCIRPRGTPHRAWSATGCIAIVIYR
ncbi:cupin domain-containing protein [Pseudomonas sp. P115]|uniref:cupin domain-containing protein n=1 Tax=Pseudomonas pisciculturae TaxID=2730413 RepID=UPI00135BC6F4|nr:cupin domain-containing protein [Pseudomonas pisciculturae]MBF6029813.1 cupin domain-containing protein [Pseudomonas pisciculturae]